MKNNKHVISDSFALNHELFALEWDTCVILHFYEGKPCSFIVSREEWLHSGKPNQQNQELQVFIEMPTHRRIPMSLVEKRASEWFEACFNLRD
jgi:hypothetical protein